MIDTVKAHKIDNLQIYYECRHCWTKYKKNGEPRKNAKRIMHICGGSANNFNNRTELRNSMCLEKNRKSSKVLIVIDDDTQKIDDPELREILLYHSTKK